ncbi:MAG: DUF4214 domain-containing protein [Acidobacteria bacterium]|nr:DUF4214 domain-containing protein [Acidobacteriota bacterium]
MRAPRTRFLSLCLLTLACACAAAARADARVGAAAAVPVINVADASIGEGDGRSDDMVFVVTLSEPSAQTVTVAVTTQAVSATPGHFYDNGTDYNETTGTLTIPAGFTYGLIPVGIVPDAVQEPDETFKVLLSSPANAVIGDGEAVGTIKDDDGAVFTKVQLTADHFQVSESDRKIDFLVTRTGDLSAPSVVSYTTDFYGRNEYTTTVGALRFEPNETTKTFTVYVTDDAFREDKESFYVYLYGAVGCTLGKPSFAFFDIESNDAADGPSPVRAASFDPDFFVRQHYADFLGREPDAEGLAFWKNQTTNCGNPNPEVCRVNVSAAFFQSIEFQNTGYLVYRTYKAAYGSPPGQPPINWPNFLFGTRQLGQNVVVGQGDWQNQLELNKREFFDAFAQGLYFPLFHPTTLSPAQFADRLFANAEVTPTAAERQAVIGEFGGAADTADAAARARALRRVAENGKLAQQEFNRAFVLMQYFGYLRRDPNESPDRDFTGYNFWLGKLNQFNGNFVEAEMVKAFITSDEYIKRFGQ